MSANQGSNNLNLKLNEVLNNNDRVVTLTGNAANALNGSSTGGRRRTRKSGGMGGLQQVADMSLLTKRGGDNSGGLAQLSAQSQASSYKPMNATETYDAYRAAYMDAANKLPLLSTLNQKGGDSTGAIVNLTSTRASGSSTGPVMPMVSGKSASDLGPALIGGVILKPRKMKVSLNAPRKTHNMRAAAALNTTRKAPRKIRLGVKNLKTRLNRAKKAHSHAQNLSLPILKQRLVKAGVIKASSKAPEHMLRTMYADLLVTKKGL